MIGPVSSQLQRELADLVRQFGVVVWLDPADQYSGFVDALDAPFPVVRYRGSFVRALRDARGFAAGIGPEPLLLHLPGLDLAAVERTPLLELAAAGHRWSKDLRALVTAAAAGRVAPAALSAFTQELSSLGHADAWLADRLADAEGGLAAALRGVSLAELVDQLLDGGALAARVGHPDELAALWSHLHHRTGLPEAWWRPLCPPDGRFAPHDVAFALAGWAMSVEYMHDPRPRTAKATALAPAQGLPEPLVDACRQLAATLRERRGDFYQATADETEARIAAERAVAPESLGHVDTFRFEEDALLREAIRRLDPHGEQPDAWRFAIELATGRAERSFWLRRDRRRGMAWQLVLDAARLCRAIAQAGARLPPGGLDEAARWYAAEGAAVDRCHRVLLQDQALLLTAELPEFEALHGALTLARSAWASWAGDVALATSRRCAAEGFLPEPAMQQRAIFDDLVANAAEKTAYFMVDALRYEMGEALRAALEGPGVTTALSPRLAELPSVTEVGMNVLAPVSRHGKLQPALSDGKVSGFRVGEFQVRDPKTRWRAIQERVGGETCPWLNLHEVVKDSVTTLRQRVARAQVVVVHSQEIDQAGEGGLGLSAFETALHQLREACVRLRSAGVRRFVITADHGFLLLEKTESVQHGTRREPSRRHAFSPIAADHAHEVRVSLAALGYDGAPGYLMMPDGLQVFDTGRRDQTFVHGGQRLADELASATAQQAPPDFVRVVQAVFDLKEAGDYASAGALLSWLGGSGNVAASVKALAEVKGDIGSRDALGYLRGVVAIVKAAGHAGLVVVVDEAETILRMRKDSRHKSLNGIRQIKDAAKEFPGLLWLFTGTPEFFDSRYGVAGLQPLHDRIRFQEDRGFVSLRQPQMQLVPFDADRLSRVAKKLRSLYRPSSPEARDRLDRLVDDGFIDDMVHAVTAGFRGDVGVVPRQFLREFIAILDRVDENPAYEPTPYVFNPDAAPLSPEEQQKRSGAAPLPVDGADELVPAEDAW
jgi:hypothetical protein